MKKVISVILSVCILIAVIPFSVYRANELNDISIDEFACELREMQKEFPDESERLIVKSKGDINTFDSVSVVEGYGDLHIIQFDNSSSYNKALQYYQKDKDVEYVQPDMIVSTCEATVKDICPTYGNHLSWGSETIGTDDYIDTLESKDNLPEIIVGVIDTGIDLDHDFLKYRIIETGFNSANTGASDSEDDDEGHGTHVSGIIADNTTNNVKIKGFKCLNSSGQGSTSSVVTAIYAAIESGVDVINMSLGGKGYDSAEYDALKLAYDEGIVLCVAAGNSGADASKYSPACFDTTITVGAIDEYDSQPYWTNWGDMVDIVAPGVSINSSYKGNIYAEKSGTSMASPFAAAASAMLLTKTPTLNTEGVRELLVSYGREWNGGTFFPDAPILYIGTTPDNVKNRTVAPVLSVKSGDFIEAFELEITCSDAEAEIYYTTNGERATPENATLYTGPITIDKVTTVHAFSIAPDKYKSPQRSEKYNVVSYDLEENFEIDENGIITAYNGTSDYLGVQEKINGVTVRGIGDNVFKASTLAIIILPDTLESVGDYAFYKCNSLYICNCKNLKKVGKSAFRECLKLRQMDLTQIEELSEYSFYRCYEFREFVNDKVTVIPKYCFSHCRGTFDGLKAVSCPNVTRVEQSGFYYNISIEVVNMPKLEVLGPSGFMSLNNLKEIDFPNLKTLETLSGSTVGKNFSGCWSAEYVNLPSLEGAIPGSCFSYISAEIRLDKVTEVYDKAFYYCQSKKIILPKVTAIGEQAFYCCEKLEFLYLPSLISTGINVFERTTTIKTVYAPKLQSSYELFGGSRDMYLSGDYIKYVPRSETISSPTIIGFSNTYAESLSEGTDVNFIAIDKHNFVYDYCDGENLTFKCSDCDCTHSISKELVELMWEYENYINHYVQKDDYSVFLDLVPDGIINAKDFAMISKA